MRRSRPGWISTVAVVAVGFASLVSPSRSGGQAQPTGPGGAVTVEAGRVDDAQQQQRTGGRRLLAVLIGIDDYDSPDIPDTLGSVADASRVYQWLRGSQDPNWAAQSLLLIVDRGMERLGDPAQEGVRLRPTRENLTQGLAAWLAHRVRPGDVVLFYFAGHAAALPPAADGTVARQRFFLLPSDVRPAAVAETGVDLAAVLDPNEKAGELARRLRDCTVITWMDTSLWGRGPVGYQPEAWPEPKRPDSRAFLAGLVGWPGRSAWLAADGRPSGVRTDPAPPGGVMTSLVLEALGPPGAVAGAPGGLTRVLDQLRQSQPLARQGFLTLGTLTPGLGLRQQELRDPVSLPAPELVLQRGHAGLVTQWAVPADHSLLITGSDDSTIRLWNPADGSILRILSDHEIRVTSLALSADARHLFSGDGRGSLRGYDLRARRPLPIPEGLQLHRAAISQVLFLPGAGLRVVSRDADRRVVLWDLDGPRVTARELTAPGNAGATRIGPCAQIVAAGNEAAQQGVLFLLEEGGRLLRCDRDGRVLGSQSIPDEGVMAAALDDDGTRLVVGGRRGTLALHDLNGVEPARQWKLEGRIESTGWLSSSRLVAHTAAPRGSSAWLIDLDDNQPPLKLPAQPVRLAHSRDGRWVAGSSPQGEIWLWRIDEQGQPQPVRLDEPGDGPLAQGAATLHIEQGWLLAGDVRGGVHIWELPGDAAPDLATWSRSFEPSRGAVKRVRVDPTGRWLLQITTDGLACLWDLNDGGGPSVLGRAWDSGTFVPDGQRLAMSLESHAPDRPGQVVLIDREGRIDPLVFTQPDDGDEVVSFSQVAVSPDGRWVAASTSDEERTVTQGHPQVCVWELKTGKLAHTVSDHPLGVLGLAFSSDGRRLATVSEDGKACLRDLEAPNAPVLEGGLFQVPARDELAVVGLHAVAAEPGNTDRFVIGSGAGQVYLCDLKRPGEVQLLGSSRASRRVMELAFTGDGGHLAAAFEDKQIRLWTIASGRFQPVNTAWIHEERVNSVVAWPLAEPAMMISGSQDGTIRFWNLDEPQTPEIGSLAAWQNPPSDRAGRWQVDWLAYTPSGAFDSSYDGAQFVRRVGERVESFEQAVQDARKGGLVTLIARGQSPAFEWPQARPPRIAIEPPSQVKQTTRQSQLTIRYDPEIEDLRLYQDGVPVPLVDQERGPIEELDPRGIVTVQVQLRHGWNRLYAMGTRTGTIDGRSEEVSLYSTAEDRPGKLHVLAVGVGAYARRRLRFATEDAEAVATHFQRLGAQTEGGMGLVQVLLDDQVTAANIRTWMRQVRDQVSSHPEDKVALFLAGHTEISADREQFCLLMPDYPFSSDWQEVVAQRGSGDELVPSSSMQHTVTFASIYQDLVRLEALNRLVIIDACQAEAVFDDAVVRRIREVADRNAWRGRVAYLMTTRKGEPALEDAAVSHGLMTYSLLRGTGASTRTADRVAAIFEQYPTADLDRNDYYATDELQRYLNITVPPLLAAIGQGETLRRGAGEIEPASPVHGLGSTVSFPLVAVPADASGP